MRHRVFPALFAAGLVVVAGIAAARKRKPALRKARSRRRTIRP